MKLSVLENFINKQVEITAGNKTFTGILRLSDLDRDVVELLPTNEYAAKRYEAYVILTSSIVAIKPIIPRSELDDFDDEKMDVAADDDVGFMVGAEEPYFPGDYIKGPPDKEGENV